MSQTLSARAQNTKLVQRLSQLEETVSEMRSNQVQKLSFAGLTIDGTGPVGNMSANSGSVVDASGLVSTTNFAHAQVGSASTHSTTSTSPVTLATFLPFTLTRTTNVFFYAGPFGYNPDAITSNGGHYLEFELYCIETASNILDIPVWGTCTTSVTIVGPSTSFSMSVTDAQVAQSGFASLSAGTYTLRAQYNANGGGTAVLDQYNAGYIIYGT